MTLTGGAGGTSPSGGDAFSLVAIPLRRPAIAAWLRDWHVPATGSIVRVVEQRPPVEGRNAWLARLATSRPGDVRALVEAALSTDDVMAHVGTTSTDRLVPRHFLDDDDYLERNLGGWAPLWFGPLAIVDAAAADPLVAGREEIAHYGDTIPSNRVSMDLVRDRLGVELSAGPTGLPRAAMALRDRRRTAEDGEFVEELVAAIRGDGQLAEVLDPLLACDELIERLYRAELARRQARAEGDQRALRRHVDRLQRLADDHGIRLLLKGEYLLGRHRRSTVLLAEGLGRVVKQPAPEPEHDIELGARTVDGQDENWPRAIRGGAMVTPRQAMGQVVGSTAIERLNTVFGRHVSFSTLLGLSVEPFESGPTLADLAVRRPEELTPSRYDEVLVHQLACEELQVDNPDWHAANFMVTGNGLVHVDWGAARPIAADDRGPGAARRRLDQVRELAWSFQDEDLARRTVELHDHATSDADHLRALRARARALVERA